MLLRSSSSSSMLPAADVQASAGYDAQQGTFHRAQPCPLLLHHLAAERGAPGAWPWAAQLPRLPVRQPAVQAASVAVWQQRCHAGRGVAPRARTGSQPLSPVCAGARCQGGEGTAQRLAPAPADDPEPVICYHRTCLTTCHAPLWHAVAAWLPAALPGRPQGLPGSWHACPLCCQRPPCQPGLGAAGRAPTAASASSPPTPSAPATSAACNQAAANPAVRPASVAATTHATKPAATPAAQPAAQSALGCFIHRIGASGARL